MIIGNGFQHGPDLLCGNSCAPREERPDLSSHREPSRAWLAASPRAGQQAALLANRRVLGPLLGPVCKILQGLFVFCGFVL